MYKMKNSDIGAIKKKRKRKTVTLVNDQNILDQIIKLQDRKPQTLHKLVLS